MGSMSSWFAPWVDPTTAGSRTGGNTADTYNAPSSAATSMLAGPGQPVADPAVGSTPGYDAGSGVNLSGFTGQLTSAPTPPATTSTVATLSGTSGNSNPRNPGGSLGTGATATPTTGTGGAMGSPSPLGPRGGNSAGPLTADTAAGGAAPATPTIPTQSPYGNSPFAANPGFTGPYGPGSYNPQTFATQGTAQQVASQYGGTVISNPSAGLLGGVGGSPFQANQPQYMVQLANGTIIDPAKIASLYANAGPGGLTAYDQAQIQDILNGSNGAALNQVGFNGVNQAFPSGTPINAGGGVQANTGGYTPTPQAAQQWLAQGSKAATPVGTGVSTDLLVNPFNINTGGSPAPPTGNQTTTPATGNDLDPASLQAIMQFLSAYSGLGAGAGNPQGVNTQGPLSGDLEQILAGLMGNGDLYSRRKVSQVP